MEKYLPVNIFEIIIKFSYFIYWQEKKCIFITIFKISRLMKPSEPN